MPKRGRAERDDLESISKKFKRLERKLVRARRRGRDRDRHRESSSSDSSSSSSSGRSSSTCSSTSSGRSRSPDPVPFVPNACLSIEVVPRNIYDNSQPSTSRATQPPLGTKPQPPTSSATDSAAQTVTAPLKNVRPAVGDTPTTDVEPPPSANPPAMSPQLSDGLMQLLGEDPSQQKTYDSDIQPDLAIRLQHIATAGLSKEVRNELLTKYLLPGNCTLIDAPSLNAEVKAAVSESILKRDKGVEQKQKQIACAIACVAKALTLLLTADQTNTELITILMDAQKLLCDGQHAESMMRRNFVLYNLKKELKDQIQNTKIDKFLFSEGLAETLRTAKAISRSGADMKNATNKQPPKKQKQQASHLNWRAPPQNYYRPKGTQSYKNREPVHRTRRETSSRTSSLRTTSGRNRRR